MHRWLFALIAILLPFPAAAADVAYRYCTIGSGPVTLTRTLRTDGGGRGAVEQRPGHRKLAQDRSARLSDVARAERRAGVAARACTWAGKNWLYVPADAELGFAGSDKGEDRSLATGVVKGDTALFGVDPMRDCETAPSIVIT